MIQLLLNKTMPHFHLLPMSKVDQDPIVRSSIKFNHGLSVNQSFKS